ncbi:Sensitive to high expression protein 9-like protein, mitochondrial [Smittium culicis]|uniref:Sensitive to high expression protein 9-like protein, mitochondrial n=1 Tax=Smittium culicis TaxID=133412 RepID=A0A1R1YBT0_9FUNG|nr:Sensitive to high expression protein 9-like protein, mitochondrial [Smittium culicis]
MSWNLFVAGTPLTKNRNLILLPANYFFRTNKFTAISSINKNSASTPQKLCKLNICNFSTSTLIKKGGSDSTKDRLAGNGWFRNIFKSVEKYNDQKIEKNTPNKDKNSNVEKISAINSASNTSSSANSSINNPNNNTNTKIKEEINGNKDRENDSKGHILDSNQTEILVDRNINQANKSANSDSLDLKNNSIKSESIQKSDHSKVSLDCSTISETNVSNELDSKNIDSSLGRSMYEKDTDTIVASNNSSDSNESHNPSPIEKDFNSQLNHQEKTISDSSIENKYHKTSKSTFSFPVSSSHDSLNPSSFKTIDSSTSFNNSVANNINVSPKSKPRNIDPLLANIDISSILENPKIKSQYKHLDGSLSSDYKSSNDSTNENNSDHSSSFLKSQNTTITGKISSDSSVLSRSQKYKPRSAENSINFDSDTHVKKFPEIHYNQDIDNERTNRKDGYDIPIDHTLSDLNYVQPKKSSNTENQNSMSADTNIQNVLNDSISYKRSEMPNLENYCNSNNSSQSILENNDVNSHNFSKLENSATSDLLSKNDSYIFDGNLNSLKINTKTNQTNAETSLLPESLSDALNNPFHEDLDTTKNNQNKLQTENNLLSDQFETTQNRINTHPNHDNNVQLSKEISTSKPSPSKKILPSKKQISEKIDSTLKKIDTSKLIKYPNDTLNKVLLYTSDVLENLNKMSNLTTGKSILEKLSISFNFITGYDKISSLKSAVIQKQKDFSDARAELISTKKEFEQVSEDRKSSQREINLLLQRKHIWNESDVSQFTSLHKREYNLSRSEIELKSNVKKLESNVETCYDNLVATIQSRYHEEQTWSDKIRMLSSYSTFAVLLVNITFLILAQLVFEPRRRRKIIDGVDSKLGEKILASGNYQSVDFQASNNSIDSSLAIGKASSQANTPQQSDLSDKAIHNTSGSILNSSINDHNNSPVSLPEPNDASVAALASILSKLDEIIESNIRDEKSNINSNSNAHIEPPTKWFHTVIPQIKSSYSPSEVLAYSVEATFLGGCIALLALFVSKSI